VPVPNLIHPVPVTIRRQRKDLTTFASRAREPVRQMWRDGDGPGTGTEITVRAQVNFNDGKLNKPRFNAGGVEEETDGYVLFRVIDLIAAGLATDNGDGTVTFGIDRGDMITRIGRRKTNLFVLFVRDVAGYTDRGGATLLEVDFKDRHPEAPGRNN